MSSDPAPTTISVQLFTTSDSRNFSNDRSGSLMAEYFSEHNYNIVDRRILREDLGELRNSFRNAVETNENDVVISSGGTGISTRDRTIEVVQELLDKTLPGFGQLFRQLSYDEVGPYSIMSRSVAGRSKDTILIALPGSPNAIELAFEKIILKILPHMVKEVRKE